MKKLSHHRLFLILLLSLASTLLVSGVIYAESWAMAKITTYQMATIEDDWFYSYQLFAAGEEPIAVAVGDFNHDGRSDVVVTSGQSVGNGTLYIFLQSASGTLQSPASYTTGYRPDTLAVADLNDDGWDDVVVAQFGGDISVYLQEADGTLTAAIIYSTNSEQANAITTGDFNNDGRQDVAVSFFGSGHVGLFYQGSNGSLLPMTTTPTRPTGFNDMATGDFNHDGWADFVQSHGAAGVSGPALSLFVQQVGGGFVRTDMGSDNPADHLDAADINHDGWDDIAVTHLGSPALSLYLQGVEGTFTLTQHQTANPGTFAIGDINLDGRNDLSFIPIAYPELGLHLQQPDGTFALHENYPVPYTPIYGQVATVVSDINSDGRPDALVAGRTAGFVVLYHSVPDIAVNLSPQAITVRPGQTITYTTTISRLYNYTGTVTVSMSALPPGATHNLPTGPFTPTVAFSFALAIDPATPLTIAPYPVVITATDGQLTRTGMASVTVLERFFLPAINRP
jgi:hypothetical protein